VRRSLLYCHADEEAKTDYDVYRLDLDTRFEETSSVDSGSNQREPLMDAPRKGTCLMNLTFL
jgi:hypothetical protein